MKLGFLHCRFKDRPNGQLCRNHQGINQARPIPSDIHVVQSQYKIIHHNLHPESCLYKTCEHRKKIGDISFGCAWSIAPWSVIRKEYVECLDGEHMFIPIRTSGSMSYGVPTKSLIPAGVIGTFTPHKVRKCDLVSSAQSVQNSLTMCKSYSLGYMKINSICNSRIHLSI